MNSKIARPTLYTDALDYLVSQHRDPCDACLLVAVRNASHSTPSDRKARTWTHGRNAAFELLGKAKCPHKLSADGDQLSAGGDHCARW